MNFDFITDPRYKELLQRDYQELKSCMDIKASKAALVLSGSIIEACLIEYFLQNLPNGKTQANVLKMTLANLIDLAEMEGLLSQRDKHLASVIRDYRNLIHPAKQIRKDEKYTTETATVAHSLVTIVLDAIRNKQKNIITFSAQEIIDKLKQDWNFQSIYSKVILKLNPHEKSKLLDLLIYYEIEEKEQWDHFQSGGPFAHPEAHNLNDIKSLVAVLKPLLSPEVIKSKLDELTRDIQTGSQLKAFCLYNLFHEEVGSLSPDDQDLVAIYMVSTYNSLLDHTRTIAEEKTYSTIGKYIKTPEAINETKTFAKFCAVHFSNFDAYFDLFEQVMNSLDPSIKTDVLNDLEQFLIPYSKVPQNIKDEFVVPAIQRNLLPLSLTFT